MTTQPDEELADQVSAEESIRSGRFLAYLRLFRAPNVFTAMADVAMGFLVTSLSLSQLVPFVLLVTSSALLYTAGMILNDVYDVDVDRLERPFRPLPSGQIDVDWARTLGYLMLAGGVACGWVAGYVTYAALGPPWRTGLVATILAGAVLFYDAWAKRTRLGPIAMGFCRFLNVLLGMSLNAIPLASPLIFGFDAAHLTIAAGIGCYIVGVTTFARHEALTSHRGWLALGVLIMAAGLGLLAAFPTIFPVAFQYRMKVSAWPLAVFVMSIWILRRALSALMNPTPENVQSAVKICILSLIVLDACVCTLIAPTDYAIGIIALLAPTMALGRWVYST